MRKILLDARVLAHPEPFTLAVGHLQEMTQKEYLYMLNNKNPLPLIELANNNGFHHLSHEDEKGIWHILISKNSEQNLKALLDV